MKKSTVLFIFFVLFFSNSFFRQGSLWAQDANVVEQSVLTWKDLVKNSWEFYYQGKNDKAVQEAQKAVELVENEFGVDHKNRTLPLKNLADIYNVVGEDGKAEKLYKEIIVTIENLMGKDHPLVANFINNLAAFYYYQEQYEKAEPLFLKALEMYTKSSGPDKTDMITALDNLAAFFESKKEPEKAKEYKKEALALEMGRSDEYHTGTPVRFPGRESILDFVFDESNLMTEEVRKRINEIGLALQSKRNISLFVAVVDSMTAYGAIGWAPEVYAAQLLEDWQEDKQTRGLALLLFISSADHIVHIEITQTSDPLAGSKLETIKENIILKRFREEHYSDGILEGVTALEKLSLTLLEDL